MSGDRSRSRGITPLHLLLFAMFCVVVYGGGMWLLLRVLL